MFHDSVEQFKAAGKSKMLIWCLKENYEAREFYEKMGGKVDESSLFTIFVLPEYHGQGIGRKIIDTLEKDEYFLRANRIEIPASITATPFYIKMGYTYKIYPKLNLFAVRL